MPPNENRKRFEAKLRELDILVEQVKYGVNRPASQKHSYTLDAISQLEARLIELSMLHALDMVDMMELGTELDELKLDRETEDLEGFWES